MAATLTLTGTIGPGTNLSAQVFSGVRQFHVDAVNNVIQIDYVDTGKQPTFVSVAAAATVTATKSGSTWTLTVS